MKKTEADLREEASKKTFMYQMINKLLKKHPNDRPTYQKFGETWF